LPYWVIHDGYGLLCMLLVRIISRILVLYPCDMLPGYSCNLFPLPVTWTFLLHILLSSARHTHTHTHTLLGEVIGTYQTMFTLL